MGSRHGAVMTALASQKSGSGAILGVDAICVLSLLLVLVLAPRGFFSRYSGFPLSPQKTSSNSSSIWRVSPYCKVLLIISSSESCAI